MYDPPVTHVLTLDPEGQGFIVHTWIGRSSTHRLSTSTPAYRRFLVTGDAELPGLFYTFRHLLCYHVFCITNNWFLKNWKKSQVNPMAIIATSRATRSHACDSMVAPILSAAYLPAVNVSTMSRYMNRATMKNTIMLTYKDNLFLVSLFI